MILLFFFLLQLMPQIWCSVNNSHFCQLSKILEWHVRKEQHVMSCTEVGSEFCLNLCSIPAVAAVSCWTLDTNHGYAPCDVYTHWKAPRGLHSLKPSSTSWPVCSGHWNLQFDIIFVFADEQTAPCSKLEWKTSIASVSLCLWQWVSGLRTCVKP